MAELTPIDFTIKVTVAEHDRQRFLNRLHDVLDDFALVDPEVTQDQ